MQRLIFANQLRGIAVLAVVFSHLVGVFWGMRDFVGLASASPAQSGPPPDLFILVSHPWFNFGPFGVGLFFLISGLVIPFSLERHTRGTFLMARALRIYPTYAAALLIEMAVLHAGSLYWQRPFPYDLWTIVTNLLLLHLLSGFPSVDLVNWTLGVELKFYLVMCLAAPMILRGRVGVLFVMAGLIIASHLMLMLPPIAAVAARQPDISRQLSTDSLFLIFMFMGVLFYCHARGLLSAPVFCLGLGTMLLLFLGCWRVSLISEQFPGVAVNYLYGFVMFSLAYLGQRHARPLIILDFFASISYPLYLVHSIIGYSILKILMLTHGFSYEIALPMALGAVIILATALHHTVERLSISLGQALASPRGMRTASIPVTGRPG